MFLRWTTLLRCDDCDDKCSMLMDDEGESVFCSTIYDDDDGYCHDDVDDRKLIKLSRAATGYPFCLAAVMC